MTDDYVNPSRVPGFPSGRSKVDDDYTTEMGARRLCERIEARWREAGYPDVYAVPVRAVGREGEKRARYDVRVSGLVNGLPRNWRSR